MNSATRPVLIVAGGTGGHIFPALAVAEQLRDGGVPLVWLGSKRGLETRIVPQAGIELVKIAVSGLRGSGIWRWLVAPISVTLAILQAVFAMLKVRPQLVLGMGGFASGPGGIAAWICRRPLVIHEQNSIPGLTNTLLSRFARKVLQGFPGAFPAAENVITVGNPVRSSIVSSRRPIESFTVPTAFNVLIVGGSRGAATLNSAVPNVLVDLRLAGMKVRHQCGAENADTTRSAYAHSNLEADVCEFIEDMGGAYRWASVVICRAGALTVSELAAAGAAAILVPYPHAVDDHQTANARFLVDEGAALFVPEGDAFEKRLGESVTKLHADREQLFRIASRAHELSTPDAASAVAAHCREFLNG